MKISHDKSSWKAGGIIARDERHTKDSDETPTPKANKKKSTKRWCKGKEGREHTMSWVPYNSVHQVVWGKDWLLYRCSTCKKVLDRCYSQVGNSKCQLHKVRHV